MEGGRRAWWGRDPPKSLILRSRGLLKGPFSPPPPLAGPLRIPASGPALPRGRAPWSAETERARRGAPLVPASPGQEGGWGNADLRPRLGSQGPGRRETSRSGEGEGSTCGKPKTLRPWIQSLSLQSLPFPFSRAPGVEESGPLWKLPVPWLPFACATRFAFSSYLHPPCLPSSPFPVAVTGGGSLRATLAGAGARVAHRLPQANFVHFRVSLLCKLRKMGGVGDPRPLHRPQARMSRAFACTLSFSPPERKSPGTKAATPRPRRPGRGG